MPSRILIFLIFLTLLQGCKPWEDLNGPVSGVKVVKPGRSLSQGDTVVFSGTCIDEKGVTGIEYGIVTFQYPWEGTNSTHPVRKIKSAEISGTSVSFIDSLFTGQLEEFTDAAQGRVLSYSFVTNVDGAKSDSNKAFKYFFNRNYPFLEVSSPLPNASFNLFRIGDTARVTGRVKYNAVTPTDTLVVTAQPCLYFTDGTLDTTGPKTTFIKIAVPNSIDSIFTARKVEMPIDAQFGQLYRLKISAKANGHEFYQAPGFQLRTQ